MNELPVFGFLWPKMLWLLLLVPLLGAGYARLDRRRRRVAVRYPALEMVGGAHAAARTWRRHLPPAMMLLGLATMIVAVARPQAMMMLPSRLQTVVLAMDMSGSMRAQDLKPSRLQAAREAAKAFIAEQPATVSVGVVGVAGAAAVVQPPTRKKADVAQAVDHLQPQRGTALGSGLVIALTTLLPHSDIDAEHFMDTGDASKRRRGVPAEPEESAEPAAPGSYGAGAIVLLSDGQNNIGPDALQAAKVAADHGVRIFTVGMGTPEGTVLSVDGWSARVRLDEAVLKNVADMTAAQYYRAEDTEGLKKVYRTLSARLAFDKRDTVEITALFAAAGALLVACAALLSLWWFGRVS